MEKRKNRDKKPKYQEEEEQLEAAMTKGGLGKSILILVEGETEEVYFNGLKNNELLRTSLAGVEIRLIKNDTIEIKREKDKKAGANKGDIRNMVLESIKEHHNYDKIWIVADNDKRNAFILDEQFLNKIKHNLPEKINQILIKALDENPDLCYFLSIHDYLRWVCSILGKQNAIKYWDRIQHLTNKNEDFELFENKNPYALFVKKFYEYDHTKNIGKCKDLASEKIKNFDVNWKDYAHLAYSCIAFEFWLLLHFEQNRSAFLSVDKELPKTIDVVTYFRKQHKNSYGKGKYDFCNSYTCLQDDYSKKILPINEERAILLRIITAYRNAKWLEDQMQPILKRQNGKYYEVNPYIKGLDNLIAELLNIKKAGEEIDYFGCTIKFEFDKSSCNLELFVVHTMRPETLDITNKDSFTLISTSNQKYEPVAIEAHEFPNTKPATIQYNIPQTEREDLVLQFKDFRGKSKSTSLFILL